MYPTEPDAEPAYEDLLTPDVQLVHDLHELTHEFRRRAADNRVGLGIGPDADVARARRGWCCLAAGARLQLVGEVLLELGREFLGVGVTQVTHLRVAAEFEWRVEMCNQGPETQAISLVAAYEDTVGPGVCNEAGRCGSRIRALRL